MANAEIVAIGSELLLGQIVDTNSAWMAQRLTALGVNLYFKSVVGDNPERMKEVIARAVERADIVITSGGIGPTQDDLTRDIVAEVTGRKLVQDAGMLEQVEGHFRRRGRPMTPNNLRQSYMPEGAIPVKNPNGTAPSFVVEDPRAVIFSLPGVPVEMKWLFENEVEPYLRKKFNLAEVIHYRVLKIVGIGESAVDDKVGHLIANSSNPTVGVLALPGQVDVRIAAKAANRAEAMKMIAPVEEEVRELVRHGDLRRRRRNHGDCHRPIAAAKKTRPWRCARISPAASWRSACRPPAMRTSAPALFAITKMPCAHY